MPKTALDSQIRSCVDNFVAEITDLVRDSALEAVHEALAANATRGRSAASAPTRRRAARTAVPA